MAEKIASIQVIPVVYEKGTTGAYILDSRGDKKIIKLGDRVEKQDDWESLISTEYTGSPIVDVITNLAEPTLSKTFLDIIVPDLVSNRIDAGLVLYENWGATLGLIYPEHATHGISFNKQLFKDTLQNEINTWSGVTNYQTYFNSYPHDLQVAYESYILDDIHGDGVDIPGITNTNCLSGITLLNLTVAAAREVSPSSRVYHYNAPLLPYNMPAPVVGSDWYQRSDYTNDSLYTEYKLKFLQRFEDKVNLIKSDSDVINLEVYAKHFPGYTYPSPPIGTGYPDQNALKAKGTKEFTYMSCKEAFDNLQGKKKVQLSTSPVYYYPYAGITGIAQVEVLDSLVWSDEMMSNYIIKPAKDAGARSMFLWGSWYFDSVVAARPLTLGFGGDGDNLTLVKRKMFNDLFTDTGYTGTIGLTNDSVWAAQNTKLYAMTAATQKTVSLAKLFRQL